MSGAIIVEHRSSFSIRIQSPKINKLESFESQKSKIIEGLNNLNKIKDWLLKIWIILNNYSIFEVALNEPHPD